MLQYHSIPHIKESKILGQPVYSFYKYDGSNLRFEFNHKKGFYKFGSRTQLIDKNTPIFGEGISLFQDTISQDIIYKLKENYSHKDFNNFERIVVFCEFFGANSFAGNHNEKDTKELKLFDIHLFKKGFIEPKKFIEIFNQSDYMAKNVYIGNLNKQYIEKIQNNIKNEYFEGVICKAVIKNQVHMTKIKTYSWIERLKSTTKDWEKLV